MAWQPIETAPKDGTSILAIIRGCEPSVVQWVDMYGKAGWSIDPENFEADGSFEEAWLSSEYEPEYWMPLDALPPLPTVAH